MARMAPNWMAISKTRQAGLEAEQIDQQDQVSRRGYGNELGQTLDQAEQARGQGRRKIHRCTSGLSASAGSAASARAHSAHAFGGLASEACERERVTS